jgi:hypothetical protein
MEADPAFALSTGVATGPSLDTLEARWFAEGNLPAGALAWFTRHGTLASVERRTDEYDVEGVPRVGTKLRHGLSLETKLLRSVYGSITPPWGVTAPLEAWRKWELDTGADEVRSGRDLIAVHKQVFTRVFTSSPSARGFVRCEAEIASLMVGGTAAWTLAFEASGAPDRREAMIRWTLDHITSDCDRVVDLFRRRLRTAGSYPEWLSALVSSRRRG